MIGDDNVIMTMMIKCKVATYHTVLRHLLQRTSYLPAADDELKTTDERRKHTKTLSIYSAVFLLDFVYFNQF